MSHVFPRVVTRTLPTAVSAEGVWIVDADGRRYLDGSGGAIVVGVGHGDASLIAAAEEQLRRTQYVAPDDVHHRRGRGLRRRRRERAPARGCPCLPGERRFGGRRDRAQDGARVPPGAGQPREGHA